MAENILEQTSSEENQYVVFKLGAEVFGLDIDKVKEIIVYQDTTQLPGSSHEIEGIINLRGHIIPIYDIRKKFGFPITDHVKSSRIVVVEVHDNTIGIIVDGVSEVFSIPGNLIEKPSAMIVSGTDANYIKGIAKMENELVILLDFEKVIDPSIAQAV